MNLKKIDDIFWFLFRNYQNISVLINIKNDRKYKYIRKHQFHR